MSVPSAIEYLWYILVTRWLGGEKRRNRKGYVSEERTTREDLSRTVSDSISGAKNCTVTRRRSAHWLVMSEGSKHVWSINCCID